MKIAVLDFETTGLDIRTGQVIEGAVVLVDCPDNKTLGNETDSYASFNDPGFPISAEIAKLTGIRDDMVKGHTLDWARFNAVVSQADLIIAHNARFDRAWLEHFGKFNSPKWGCSLAMIDWKSKHGLPCATLKHLAWEHDYFPNAHRAVDDVRTLVHLLRQPAKANPEITYFEELATTAAFGKRLVLAKGSPFEKKDLLKAKEFSWAPNLRVWWKLIKEPEWEEMKTWLDAEIYNGRPSYETIPQADYLAANFKAQYRLD